MVDFTQYQPPGVYVEDTTTPLVTTTGIPPSVVALVGPAVGYQSYSESIAVSSAAGTNLSKQGIYGPSSAPPGFPVFTATLLDGTPLAVNTDFTVAQTGAGHAATTSITRVAGSAKVPNDGTTIVVSYSYTEPDYFLPQTFEDFTSIVSFYGSPFVTVPPTNPATSQVISPLAAAAMFAILNGANQVVGIATDPTLSLEAGLQAAYTSVLTDPNVNIIVPLPVDTATNDAHTYASVQQLADDLAAHVLAATDEGFPRLGIFGPDVAFGLTGLSYPDLAANVSTKRVILAAPEQLNYFNGSVNQTVGVAGYYFAAALAGRLSSNPVQQPLTKQIIKGFSGFPTSVAQRMTRSYKDSLAKAGVLVGEVDRNNTLTVRHGVTTDMSSLITREISIVRIQDALFELIQTGMDNAGLVGSPITIDTPIQVKGVLTGILESAVSTGTIIGYNNLAVRQQQLPSGDPTVIECRFSYQPAVPLNYITVSFSIDLTNGDTTGLTDTTGATATPTA